jgi:hypothetical protein
VTTTHTPATAGQAVTFTATVLDTGGHGTPTGHVEFFDGSLDLGTGSALTGAGNRATSTFTTSQLGLGPHTIRAVYLANNGFLSSSGTVTQTIDAATRTTITTSTNPSPAGQSLTFTATVTDFGGGVPPAGRVVFYAGTTRLGVGTPLAGSGAGAITTFTTTHLARGKHIIKAVFIPSGSFLSSSGTWTQIIT